MMKTGLMQCKDAILNTVGPNAKPFDKDIVKKITKEKEKERKKIKNPKKVLDANSKTKQERKGKVQDNILLGKMGRDVTFLRDLLGPDTEVMRPSFSDEQVGSGKFNEIMITLCTETSPGAGNRCTPIFGKEESILAADFTVKCSNFYLQENVFYLSFLFSSIRS